LEPHSALDFLVGASWTYLKKLLGATLTYFYKKGIATLGYFEISIFAKS
jgi:hypothetical protein